MLIAGIGRPDLNREGRRERTATSLLGSMGLPGSLTRRRFLAGSAAAGATAGLGSWAARAAPNLSGVTLNLMVIQPHVVGGRMGGEAFEKATGAKVNVIAVPNDQILEKVTLDVQSGANVFDVVDYWYGLLGAFAHDGMIVDVTDRIAKEIDGSGFLSILWDPYTLAEGKRWGLPYDGDAHVLFTGDPEGNFIAPRPGGRISATKTVTTQRGGNGISERSARPQGAFQIGWLRQPPSVSAARFSTRAASPCSTAMSASPPRKRCSTSNLMLSRLRWRRASSRACLRSCPARRR
jgi:hypothetical protein